MEWFTVWIEFFVSISVGVTIVRVYLELNKKWKWKYDKKVVDSISVIGLLIGIGASILFFIKFAFIDKSPAPSVSVAFLIFNNAVLLLIGAGMWTKDNRGVSFFRLLARAFRSDHKVSGDLIKSFIRPKGAEQVIMILKKVAEIDKDIAEEEIQLIHDFCRQWKVPPPSMQVGKTEKEGDLLELRQSLAAYLKTRPLVKQVHQLKDILELLIKIDHQETNEEFIVFSELSRMIQDYTETGERNHPPFEVLLIPQQPEQIGSIQSLFPHVQLSTYCGGKAFLMGEFYSEIYAEAICQKYIKQGFFSVWQVNTKESFNTSNTKAA